MADTRQCDCTRCWWQTNYSPFLLVIVFFSLLYFYHHILVEVKDQVAVAGAEHLVDLALGSFLTLIVTNRGNSHSGDTVNASKIGAIKLDPAIPEEKSTT